jgi:hypothetical protein
LKIGEFLILHNLINQAQLEEALQAQVIFGGKLGTILIEMGLISEKTLATALTKLLGFPCAQPDQLEEIPENVIKIISAELAEKHKAVPMSVSGRKLTLAMANPQDLKAIDEIAFRTGYIVLPILALEVRLVLALESYYGIKRTMRYITPPKKVRDELDQFESSLGYEPKTLLEEAGYEDDGKQPFMPVEVPPPVEAPSVSELDEEEIIEELTDEEVTLESVAAELIEARDRNHVADSIVKYLGAHYARAALFMVVGGMVTGWRSVKNGQPIPGFEEFQLPLSEASVLKTAVDSQSFFLGPVPQNGANLALTTLLGKPAPKTVILLPMTMLGRVVGLIYVDDPDCNLSEHVVVLQQLAAKALMTFEILILHNKILRI